MKSRVSAPILTAYNFNYITYAEIVISVYFIWPQGNSRLSHCSKTNGKHISHRVSLRRPAFHWPANTNQQCKDFTSKLLIPQLLTFMFIPVPLFCFFVKATFLSTQEVYWVHEWSSELSCKCSCELVHSFQRVSAFSWQLLPAFFVESGNRGGRE